MTIAIAPQYGNNTKKIMQQLYPVLTSRKFNAIAGCIFLILIGSISFYLGRITAPSQNVIADSRSAPLVKAQKNINKSFTFSAKDENGVEITKITYVITSASLQDQIIIHGQRAHAIKGKTFLVISFNLTNTSDKYIQVISRDYVRLVEHKGVTIAPDIHNDPMQIQPISTKESRIGFSVDDTEKKFFLQVGEIDGEKTSITFDL